jgi:beta-phosphoglucomutase-like phosphatase (HAD superfamily)
MPGTVRSSPARGYVVFDLDGTLIESEQIWRDVRHEYVVECGGRWREDAQRAMMGMRTQEWASYMHDALGVPRSPAVIAEQVVARVIERLSEGIPVIQGAGVVLQRLAGAFVLGLATSSALAAAQFVLAKTGWQKYFAAVVSADSVARGKPAPDVYQRALKLLEAEAGETAAIEDSANGIRSAHAAGLAVIAVPNHEFPPDAQALALAAEVVPTLAGLDASTIQIVLRR